MRLSRRRFLEVGGFSLLGLGSGTDLLISSASQAKKTFEGKLYRAKMDLEWSEKVDGTKGHATDVLREYFVGIGKQRQGYLKEDGELFIASEEYSLGMGWADITERSRIKMDTETTVAHHNTRVRLYTTSHQIGIEDNVQQMFEDIGGTVRIRRAQYSFS